MGVVLIDKFYVQEVHLFAGIYSPHLVRVKSGDHFGPSCAAVPLGPRTCPKKTKRGVRGWHGLRASCQCVGKNASGAALGTWERLPWACFFYTPQWPENRGYPPPLTIFQKITALNIHISHVSHHTSVRRYKLGGNCKYRRHHPVDN